MAGWQELQAGWMKLQSHQKTQPKQLMLETHLRDEEKAELELQMKTAQKEHEKNIINQPS